MINGKKPGKTVGLVVNHTSDQDSEKIQEKPTRRSFTIEYKRKILKRLEGCAGSRGAVGELLRVEGLYSSQIASWKREAESSFAKKRGPKPNPEAKAEKKISALQKKIALLEGKLEQAEMILDIQKKLSIVLGVKLPPRCDDKDTSR